MFVYIGHLMNDNWFLNISSIKSYKYFNKVILHLSVISTQLSPIFLHLNFLGLFSLLPHMHLVKSWPKIPENLIQHSSDPSYYWSIL